MTAWTVVLVASLSMPVLMHRVTLTIPAATPPLRLMESLSSTLSGLPCARCCSAMAASPGRLFRFPPNTSTPSPLSEQVAIPALPAQAPLALPPAPGAIQPPYLVTPHPDRRGSGWSGLNWRALPAAVWPAPRCRFMKAGPAALTCAQEVAHLIGGFVNG
jgi:hypothetical protein